MSDNTDKFESNMKEGTKALNDAMKNTMGLMDNILNSLIPNGATKNVKLVIIPERREVIRKGFLGIGRKESITPAVTIDANAFISMNNIITIDIADKVAMKKYFDSL